MSANEQCTPYLGGSCIRSLKDPQSSSHSYMDKTEIISDLKEDFMAIMFRMPLIFDIYRTQPSGKDFTVCSNPYCDHNSRSLQTTWQYKEYKDYNLRKNSGIQSENSWNNQRSFSFVRQSLLCEGQVCDKKPMQTYLWYVNCSRRPMGAPNFKEWCKVSLNNNKNKPIRGWTWLIYVHFIFQ